MNSNIPEISARNLSKILGGRLVLDQVSLDVQRGEYVALVGPSGAGKSTFLKLLAGHGSPSDGQISLCGRACNGLSPADRPTSLMFQEYSLFDHMSNWENIVFPLKVQRKHSRKNIEYAAALVADAGLSEIELKKPPTEISGGERQRVALARALVWRPRILLLDEPLASIDPSLRSELRQLLAQLTQTARVTTVHVTHSLSEAFELGSRVGVLLRGRLAQNDSPRDLYMRPANLEIAIFLGYVCVELSQTDRQSENLAPGASVFAAVPFKLRPAAQVQDGPRILGQLKTRSFLPNGFGEHCLIELSYSAAKSSKSVHLPLENTDPNWQPVGVVIL